LPEPWRHDYSACRLGFTLWRIPKSARRGACISPNAKEEIMGNKDRRKEKKKPKQPKEKPKAPASLKYGGLPPQK
jgi:hypothetical protein